MEIDQIETLLDRGDARLLTLTGPGGIGKTRLAIEVASRLEPDFANGACFVSLAAIRDPEIVVPAIGRVLGLEERGGETIEQQLIPALRREHLLLVIDNVEHVVEIVAPWLAKILAACPRLTVLATSRQALHISGEQRFVVPPLPLPDADARELSDVLNRNAAVALFAQRATAASPDFALTAENAATVAAIVRRLDGVPLAIELAAARSPMLSPAALLARLSGELDLLADGRRVAPERHRTMRAAIAWSYELLPPAAQRLMRHLAVFVGGFSLDAAEAIAGDSAFELLSVLVEQSLAQRLPGDAPRFRMLEPIRDFALEELASCGEEVDARDMHAAFSLRLGELSDPGMRGPDLVQWLDTLEREHDNLRLALDWLASRGRDQAALELIGLVWLFFWLRGHQVEAMARFDTLLMRVDDEPTLVRARALYGAGSLARSLGQVERSLALLQEALAVSRAIGDREYEGYVLQRLWPTLTQLERVDEGVAAATEALTIARERNDHRLIGAARHCLGATAVEQGRVQEGLAMMLESDRACRIAGDPWILSVNLSNLAWAWSIAGDHERQEAAIAESVRLVEAMGSKRDMPNSLIHLAVLARERGDLDAAGIHVANALRIAHETGDKQHTAIALAWTADIAVERGEAREAIERLRESTRLLREIGARAELVWNIRAMAFAARGLGDMARASRFLGAAGAGLAALGIEVPTQCVAEDAELRGAAVAVIGKHAYEAQWAAGHDMPLEAAVAETLAWYPLPAGGEPARPDASATTTTRGLSPRELEVLRLMADGHTDQQIADALFISRRTVTNHTSSVLGKLDVTSRTAAVAYAIRRGLA
jgi:predicted ATPase/DNA-binding CsgD family transcriptional regulator